jgi:hypothetical protein
MNTGIISSRWPTIVATVAGGLSAALGLTFIMGWHPHDLAISQILPSFIAMVYNTAVGFLLCGAALLMIALGPTAGELQRRRGVCPIRERTANALST